MKNILELRPASITDKYRKKWNERMEDFLNLYKNGKLVSNTLYRTGMFGGKVEDKYFIMLKHVEAYYEDSITKDEKKKPHLESQWCIIDNNGVEKVNFEQFATPYLQGGQIYSLNGRYYNIETGYFYCDARANMDTEEFLFLNNAYDNDKEKRGVLKITKSNGMYKLFKEKAENL